MAIADYMSFFPAAWLWRGIGLALAAGLLTSCADDDRVADSKALATGDELIVLTRNAPTTWYQGRAGLAGPEHDLVNDFAQYAGFKVRFRVLGSIDEILREIRAGRGHMAAAGITRTEGRNREGFVFGPAYQQVEQQVVCRRNAGKLPKTVADLSSVRLTIIADSSYRETLVSLQRKFPELNWNEAPDTSTELLLEKVWRKQIDCTIADSTIVNINRRYYPELVVAFSIGQPQAMSWLLSPRQPELAEKLQTWFQQVKQSGRLANIQERYYGHVEIFDYVDMKKFLRRIEERLPQYKTHFQKAAEESGIPWTLLAAQSYQESHWRANAKSPTGVRGMMMLTLNTARSLGVTNRLDVSQSIHGGARYLSKMLKRIPETVKDEDRLWYALAAYNVGYGHLSDARRLATRLNKNPDRWMDLKQVFPLLMQKKYYKSLRYGYARGTEPVRYVQRIRDYQQVLERNT